MSDEDYSLTYAAFLRDVARTPMDMVPRQIFADWLEDSDKGGASLRAYTIRTMIARPEEFTQARVSWQQTPEELRKVDDWLMATAAHEMVTACGVRGNRSINTRYSHPWQPWEHTISGDRHAENFTGNSLSGLLWRRGFVERVGCSWELWIEWGPVLVRVMPILKVNIFNRPPTVRLHYHGQHMAGWRIGSDVASIHAGGEIRQPDGETLPSSVSRYLPGPEGYPRGLLAAYQTNGGHAVSGLHPHTRMMLYKSEEEAIDALGVAMLGWARGMMDMLPY